VSALPGGAGRTDRGAEGLAAAHARVRPPWHTCAIHEVGDPIRASTIAQLTHTAIPSNHVLEVFEDLDVMVDDRPDSVQF
jgi:hypothetical protein